VYHLNATNYLSIVSDHVHLFMSNMYPSSDGYFQQDNAPCYKARIISDWFLEHDKKVHCTKITPTVARSQPNRASLGCGGTVASCPGCASHKSPSTPRCYPINMGQHFERMLSAPCLINAM